MNTPAQPDPDSLTIGQSIAAFMLALHNLGDANKEWERRQDEANATRLDAATGALDTALAMVGISVSTGTAQTRGQVEAWRVNRRLVMPGSMIGRVVLPS